MEIRDPIYGFIQCDEEKEEKLINSSIFQRLRNIKQLALASFVYPGAHHTRFEHSIGTMHLAGKIARELKLDDEKVKILRLAGLLHDLGHGPFSHVSEQIMEKHYPKEILEQNKAQSAHELISILLIQRHKEITGILTREEIKSIISLLQKQERRSVEKDVISGPLDVDKLDYLRRDSYFVGVKYGVFDLEKVVESLTKIEISSEETSVGIKEEGVHAVEQFLLAKYHMTSQVYQHRLRRITDAMLICGIEYALEEGLTQLSNLFELRDVNQLIEDYIKYDDNFLMDAILLNAKGKSRVYMERIKARKPLKEVFSVEINDVNFPDSILLHNVLRDIEEHKIEIIAKNVAKVFTDHKNMVDPDLVILDKQTYHNPTFRSPEVRIFAKEIMVKTKGRMRKEFPDVSTIFSNPAVEPEKNVLYIYLPLDGIEKREDREAFIEARQTEVLNIIKEELQ